MIDEVLIQGGLAAAAGLGVAVGGIYFIEKKAAMGAETGQLSQEQVNKFAMEGSEAENKFSGSDQTLDDLIAAMETAQVLACFLRSRAMCVAQQRRAGSRAQRQRWHRARLLETHARLLVCNKQHTHTHTHTPSARARACQHPVTRVPRQEFPPLIVFFVLSTRPCAILIPCHCA